MKNIQVLIVLTIFRYLRNKSGLRFKKNSLLPFLYFFLKHFNLDEGQTFVLISNYFSNYNEEFMLSLTVFTLRANKLTKYKFL